MEDQAASSDLSSTEPMFLDETATLVKLLQGMPKSQLKSLLDISDDLAGLNYSRYQSWEQQATKQCVLAFNGPAYKSLQAKSFTPEQHSFAQQHLRILSGCYGLLRPQDLIRPYRLDMGRKLANPRGKDLYAFWSALVTERINRELDACANGSERFIINVASQEYFKCVAAKSLRHPVYTCTFPGPAVYAKQARGALARFAITRGVLDPEGLKDFTGNDGEWKYDPSRSKQYELVFARQAVSKPKQAPAKPAGVAAKKAAAPAAPAAAEAAGGSKKLAGAKRKGRGADKGEEATVEPAAPAAEPAAEAGAGADGVDESAAEPAADAKPAPRRGRAGAKAAAAATATRQTRSSKSAQSAQAKEEHEGGRSKRRR